MAWRAAGVGVIAVAVVVSLAGFPAQAATAKGVAVTASGPAKSVASKSRVTVRGSSKSIEREAVAKPGKPADPTVRKVARKAARSAAASGATPRSLHTAAATADAGQSVLSGIGVSPDLNCSATSTGYEAHPGIFYADTACGTFLWVNGTLYGPAQVPAGPGPVGWTPVSQQTTGAGTSANPFVTVTVVAAGGTGVTLTEADSFVAGSRSWTTSVGIANPSGASVTRLSRGQDCYVAASDTGNGQFDAATNTTFCEGATAAIGLTPLTAGSSFVESSYSNVWSQITSGGGLSDTFYPPLVDNGQAVSWDVSGSTAGAWSWRTTVLVGPTAREQGGAANSAERQTTCSTARPVNCATGDFWHTFTDVDVASRGLSLLFSRTYDAADASVNGPLGYGWTDSLGMRVALTDAGATATVTQENGTDVTFSGDGAGGWTAPARVLATLTGASDGGTTFLRYADHIAYHFDAAGILRTVTDRDGDVLTLAYTAGQVTSVTDGSGRHLTLTYAGGRIATVADPLGRTTYFGYDAAGNLASAADPLGRAWTFTYDSAHRLLTARDPRGSTTGNTYDDQGRVTAQQQPDGKSIAFAYSGDPASTDGSTTTLTDIHGNQSVYTYVNMLLTAVETGAGTDADGTTSYTYDIVTLGRTSIKDANGNRSQEQYDGHGNVIASTDAAGAGTTYTYDAADNRTSVTTPAQETASYGYDAHGNVTDATDALGHTMSFTYGDAAHPGDLTKVTDPVGHVTTTGYDAYGEIATRSVSPTAGETDTSVYQHNADGELVCEVSATQHAASAACPPIGSPHAAGTTATVFDAAGQTTAVTDPANRTTSYGYDDAGNRTSTTDAGGHVSATIFDADNRPTQTTEGSGTGAAATTANGYDLAPGSQGCDATVPGVTYCATTTDGNHHTTVTSYDAAGRVIAQARPGGHLTTYGYDPAGNRISSVDPLGRSVGYSYDADSRLQSVNYEDGSTPGVYYGYDLDGHRIAMSDGTGTSTYSYDAAGRMTDQANGAGSYLQYGYDDAGNATSLTYPGGDVLTRGYDGAGRLTSVTDWNGHTTSFGYDPDGDLVQTHYANGDTSTRGYDSARQIVSASLSKPGGTLASIGYSRDTDGLVDTETDSAALTGTTAYGYDARNQMTSAASTSYGYDTAGNATTFGAATQTFAADGELTATSGGAAPATYAYDALGERTGQQSTPGADFGYSYDEAGRLTDVTRPLPAPTVTHVSPASGPAAGGTTVTVTGTGFDSATAVSFGGRGAVFTMVSATTITAKAPAGTGTADVTVTNAAGTSAAVAADRYTYVAAPAVTGLSPTGGPAAGGTHVTVTGSGFTGATAVRFGTASAAFTVTSATAIAAVAPAGTGAKDVTVTTPNGTSAVTAADKYTYTAAPTVTRLSPSAGPLAGGQKVTVTGTGFTGVTAVHFGTKAATHVAVASAGTLIATTPAGTAGTVDVTVLSTHGTSPKATADHYAYLARPAVTAVVPAAGPLGGKNTVTLAGTGFTSVSAVHFGTKAAHFTVKSSTKLTAVAPAGAKGVVHLTVTTPGGTSGVTTRDRYTYLARPALTSVGPSSGTTAGGTTVTLKGSAFTSVSAVRFGTKTARFTVKSSTLITAKSPAGAAAAVSVTVVTPGGTSPVTTHTRFTYKKPKGAKVTGRAASVVLAEYTYDGDGVRASTATGAATTAFTYGTSDGSPQLLSDGTRNYVYGPGGTLIEDVAADGTARYYFGDALGSTRALTDATGAVVATYAYDAYGKVTAHTGSADTPLTFTGGYHDAQSGLYYLINRYYDPVTGQFLTVDPALELTGQPYGYAGGNPANAIDPQGLSWWNPVSWSAGDWGRAAAVVTVVAGAAALCAATACIGNIAVLAGASTLAETLGAAEVLSDAAIAVGAGAKWVGLAANVVDVAQHCDGALLSAGCGNSVFNTVLDQGLGFGIDKAGKLLGIAEGSLGGLLLGEADNVKSAVLAFWEPKLFPESEGSQARPC